MCSSYEPWSCRDAGRHRRAHDAVSRGALTITLELPRALADAAGGVRTLALEAPAGTVRSALDTLAASHPLLHRRLRDEAGALRRYVNVYVDGADVRRDRGLDTVLADGATVTVLPSVAGG